MQGATGEKQEKEKLATGDRMAADEFLARTLREIERDDCEIERIRRLRRKSMLSRGVAFLPFASLSAEGERHSLELCVSQGCAMEVLTGHVMMCPVHAAVHRCGDRCRMTDRCCSRFPGSSCLLSLRTMSSETWIEDDAILNAPRCKEPNAAGHTASVASRSVLPARSRAPFREDLRWFAWERSFRKALLDVVCRLCDERRRSRYNAGLRTRCSSLGNTSRLLKKVSRNDVGLRVLLENDLYRLCMGLLRAAESKKTRRLLLDNAHTFLFVALEVLVRGLNENGSPVVRSPGYARRLLPLPKRTLFDQSFGLALPGHSKCRKSVRLLCEGKVFRASVKNGFRVSQ